MLIPFGVLSAAGAEVGVAGDYQLIATTILGTTTADVVFDVSSLGSTYKHLQLRYAGRGSGAYFEAGIRTRFNADTGNNYAAHFLLGNGSTVSSGLYLSTSISAGLTGLISGADSTANVFYSGYVDLLDFASTSKNKTTRALSGGTGGANRIDLHSTVWMNTSAVTSWTIFPSTGSFVAGSRFSLYGIK